MRFASWFLFFRPAVEGHGFSSKALCRLRPAEKRDLTTGLGKTKPITMLVCISFSAGPGWMLGQGGSISTTSAARRDLPPLLHQPAQWKGRCWAGGPPSGPSHLHTHKAVTGEMLASGGFGDACRTGLGRAPGEAPGLTGKSRGAGAEGQPAPAHWPGWDAAGRDFQQLSEPAKQTLAKSSRVV